MRVVAATLLAVLGGNANPTADDITKILSSVGVEAEGDSVARLLKELEGKDIAEVMAAGREKLQSVPSGGAVASAGAPAAGGAGGAAAAPAKEEKKEEPSEEDEDMGFSLFD